MLVSGTHTDIPVCASPTCAAKEVLMGQGRGRDMLLCGRSVQPGGCRAGFADRVPGVDA